VVGVTHHAGYVPGALEEEWGQVEGNFAVAAEKKDLHFEIESRLRNN
jgi:hypothetical protein